MNQIWNKGGTQTGIKARIQAEAQHSPSQAKIQVKTWARIQADTHAGTKLNLDQAKQSQTWVEHHWISNMLKISKNLALVANTKMQYCIYLNYFA